MEEDVLYYYRVNKRLLRLTGAWFHQKKISKQIRLAIIAAVLTAFYATSLILLIRARWAGRVILEVMPQFSACSAVFIKWCTIHVNADKLEELYKQLKFNWTICYHRDEVQIMTAYAEKGRMLTIYYTWYIYISAILFCTLPALPQILDLVVPLNESRSFVFPYPADYLIDLHRHYFYVLAHMTFNIFVAMTILLGTDTLFMIYIQHCCSLFAIVGYRLQHIIPSEDKISQMAQADFYSVCHRNMSRAIYGHQRAIEYARLIESSFSTSFLLQLGFWISCLTCTLLQVLLVFEEETAEGMKHVAFAVGQLFHILCACYPGQELTNHSNEISDIAIGSEWYQIPVASQKMLIFLLRRSFEPCYVTAGKIFIFGLKSFTTVVQSSVSYFMFLSSVH